MTIYIRNETGSITPATPNGLIERLRTSARSSAIDPYIIGYDSSLRTQYLYTVQNNELRKFPIAKRTIESLFSTREICAPLAGYYAYLGAAFSSMITSGVFTQEEDFHINPDALLTNTEIEANCVHTIRVFSMNECEDADDENTASYEFIFNVLALKDGGSDYIIEQIRHQLTRQDISPHLSYVTTVLEAYIQAQYVPDYQLSETVRFRTILQDLDSYFPLPEVKNHNKGVESNEITKIRGKTYFKLNRAIPALKWHLEKQSRADFSPNITNLTDFTSYLLTLKLAEAGSFLNATHDEPPLWIANSSYFKTIVAYLLQTEYLKVFLCCVVQKIQADWIIDLFNDQFIVREDKKIIFLALPRESQVTVLTALSASNPGLFMLFLEINNTSLNAAFYEIANEAIAVAITDARSFFAIFRLIAKPEKLAGVFQAIIVRWNMQSNGTSTAVNLLSVTSAFFSSPQQAQSAQQENTTSQRPADVIVLLAALYLIDSVYSGKYQEAFRKGLSLIKDKQDVTAQFILDEMKKISGYNSFNRNGRFHHIINMLVNAFENKACIDICAICEVANQSRCSASCC